MTMSNRFWAIMMLAPVAALCQPQLGEDISLSLMRPSDASTRRLPDGAAKLGTATATVKAGDTIAKLLRANGIYPNGDSIGIVYRLNPAVKTFTSLPPGSMLTLPKVTGDARLRQALARGELVVVSANDQLKREVRTAATDLAETAAVVSRLDPDRFEASGRDATVRSLNAIVDSLDIIRKIIINGNFPLDRSLLRQMSEQANLVRTTLRAFPASAEKLSAADQETIKLVEEDLELKAGIFEETRGGDAVQKPPLGVRVVVQTIKDDGSPARNLRICYIPAALFGKEPGIFGKVSSPADEMIPAGNYRMWAGAACDAPGGPPPPTFRIRNEADKPETQIVLRVP